MIGPFDEPEATWAGELWMHPSPPRLQPRRVDGLLPPRLIADYQNAIESYEHGLWRAAAQQARVVLEGVVKTVLSDASDPTAKKRTPLGKSLIDLADTVDFAKPIDEVSKVLKDGGNIASHFDSERDVTQEIAHEMIELLGAFLDYILLTPRAVTRLRQRLEAQTESD